MKTTLYTVIILVLLFIIFAVIGIMSFINGLGDKEENVSKAPAPIVQNNINE